MVKLQEAPQVLATPTGPYTTSLGKEIVMPVQLITTPCVACGKPVAASALRRSQGRGKYCTRPCMFAYMSHHAKWSTLSGTASGQQAIDETASISRSETAPVEGVRIPLCRRDGSICAYVIVDAADADWVNQWRWSLTDNGYAKRYARIDGARQQVYLHRALLGFGPDDRVQVDHINRDKLDNRRCNLRPATRAENNQNSSSQRGSSSKYRGVYWSSVNQRWVAQVKVNRRSTHVGCFTNEDEAGEAARQARLRIYPYALD